MAILTIEMVGVGGGHGTQTMLIIISLIPVSMRILPGSFLLEKTSFSFDCGTLKI